MAIGRLLKGACPHGQAIFFSLVLYAIHTLTAIGEFFNTI